jgi:hypothetical protein
MTHLPGHLSRRASATGRGAALAIFLCTGWFLPDRFATAAPPDPSDQVPPSTSPISDQDRQHWSFRPLAVPQVPERVFDRARTPIDAYLLDRLAAKGLNFSADADRATVLRRMHLDLGGLPPSPADVAEFLSDDSPDAYERQLDRLLASPYFGERWGRHWLDVAGYVDTIGFDTDATNVLLSEGKWRYRDYVIAALNEDKPYDRFITEQLAGDEIYDWRRATQFSPEIRQALIATGYLRTARDLTHEDVGVIPQNFYGIGHDTLEIVGTGLLGLTLNCARCHDHKFDPIPQEDYYRLIALLAPAYNPNAWLPVTPTETRKNDRGLPDISPSQHAESQRHNAELDKQIALLREQIHECKRPHEARLKESKLAKLPEAIRSDVNEAVQTAADRRTEVQKYLAEKLGAAIAVSAEELQAALAERDKAKIAALESQIGTLESVRQKWGIIQALYDFGPVPTTHLLIRGSETTPGNEVQPGFLRVLSRSETESWAASQAPYEGTSGRRLALARWLTRRESPAAALLARVMVNRVWQHLFGRGIVATPDNFGIQGQAPTHPELLEWLSSSFVNGEWQVKPLVRQMMLSTAYRQSSQDEVPVAAAAANDPRSIDPANELLWRMRLKRLDAETVRDSLLAASGQLNSLAGGPPVMIQALPDGMVVVAADKPANKNQQSRRSIYLVTRRAYNLTLLNVFDQPAMATNCLQRQTSAVPLQSLVMLNDAFVAEQAEGLAERVESTSAPAAEARVVALFAVALTRRPNAAEIVAGCELLADQTQRLMRAGAGRDAAEHQALVQLCHTVLNTSEFLYAE